MLNLLQDKWIPVRNKLEEEMLIAPWEVTDTSLVHVSGVRPDFQGTYALFLIGLFQTIMPPDNEYAWRTLFRRPPSEEELKKKFEEYKSYFDVFSGDKRFLQDPLVQDNKPERIGRLLLEAPSQNVDETDSGEGSQRENFFQQSTISRLCPSCASAALLTLQIQAPSGGGRGYLSGLRGHGPLTTIIIGRTLWETIWLNVLSFEDFSKLGNCEWNNSHEKIFPWLEKGSEGPAKKITPQDASPYQMFWAMPRRVFLNIVDEEGICDLCGVVSSPVIDSFTTKNGGISYIGGWRHSLSPHIIFEKDGTSKALSVERDGVSYKNWIGVVQVFSDGKKQDLPAAVVSKFTSSSSLRSKMLDLKSGQRTPIWAFGYYMIQMKKQPRCYHASMIPVSEVPAELREDLDILISQWILCSSHLLYTLSQCIKQAWYASPKNHKGDVPGLSTRFWKETEEYFYESMNEVVKTGNVDDKTLINCSWLKKISDACFRLFDEYVAYDQKASDQADPSDPKRLVHARKLLKIWTHASNKKIGDILNLPKPTTRKREDGTEYMAICPEALR